MFAFVLAIAGLTSSLVDPLPPKELASSYAAHFHLHSASPMVKSSYFEGLYVIDVDNGVKRETGLNWEGVGCDNEDSLALCNGVGKNTTAVQYFVTNQSSPSCIQPKKLNCPVRRDYDAPPLDATYKGDDTVNGVLCTAWTYYSPAAQSAVSAWFQKSPPNGHAPALIRLVELRVQHDFSNIKYGVGANYSAIPKQCL
jgi:hypothetical protein